MTYAHASDAKLTARPVGCVTSPPAAHTEIAARSTELTARNTELVGHNVELRTEMGLVKHHGSELERRLDEAQRQFVDTSMRVAAAEARADERGSDRADLRAQIAVLRDRQAHIEVENARLSWSLEEAGQDLTAAQAQTAAERAGRSEAAAALASKESLLAAISQTRVWRAAQKWYAFKRAVTRLFTGATPS